MSDLWESMPWPVKLAIIIAVICLLGYVRESWHEQDIQACMRNYDQSHGWCEWMFKSQEGEVQS